MGTVESIQAWLNSGEDRCYGWCSIIALSYLLEDLAIVTAAGLATQGAHPTSICVTCDFYRHCHRWSWPLLPWEIRPLLFPSVRYKALTNRYFRALRTKLRQNAFSSLFDPPLYSWAAARLVFTLSGFFRHPSPYFLVCRDRRHRVMDWHCLLCHLLFRDISVAANCLWISMDRHPVCHRFVVCR